MAPSAAAKTSWRSTIRRRATRASHSRARTTAIPWWRLPGWLLTAGLGLNFIALLLGLSKTALAGFSLCALILFLGNMAVPAVQRRFFQILLGLVIVVPIGLMAFEAVSGHSFVSILESRIDQTESLDWRTLVWESLLSNISLGSIWFGHGFTAANEAVFRLTFSDVRNADPLMMVHNAYIALLYDLGLPGYLMFAAALSGLWHALRGWLTAVRPALRTEHTIVFALTVYFLFVCAFDEMSYMFDAPMLFWTLITLIYCVSLRDARVSAQASHTPNSARLSPFTGRPLQ